MQVSLKYDTDNTYRLIMASAKLCAKLECLRDFNVFIISLTETFEHFIYPFVTYFMHICYLKIFFITFLPV